MASAGARTDRRIRLLRRVRCPHCWHRFAPWECLFVAGHESLRGDPVAGPDEFIRFRPSRFTSDGQAIDPGGVECRDIACPRCHLHIPRALLEFPPVSISIVGAPASGKSYYLAAMTWRLRRVLPRLGWTLADADPSANAVLHEHEQLLFMSDRPDQPVKLDKTDVVGTRLYRSVAIDGQAVVLPTPFQFTLTPREPASLRGHVLVLYDNAGEHFLPGQTSPQVPVTEHLTHSDVVFFMLDPTQDPRLREAMGLRADLAADSSFALIAGGIRQELVLNEAVVRIRKALGLSAGARLNALLMVVLAKADLWEPAVRVGLQRDEPVQASAPDAGRFDFGAIAAASRACRALLERACPEFVSLAESCFRKVIYAPVSSTGTRGERVEEDGKPVYRYRPRDLRPQWTLAPIACALGYVEPSLAPPPVGQPATKPDQPQQAEGGGA